MRRAPLASFHGMPDSCALRPGACPTIAMRAEASATYIGWQFAAAAHALPGSAVISERIRSRSHAVPGMLLLGSDDALPLRRSASGEQGPLRVAAFVTGGRRPRMVSLSSPGVQPALSTRHHAGTRR